MAKKTFQQELRDSVVNNIDPRLKPAEVLRYIFKTYVAKMLEQNVTVNKNRLEAGYLNLIKAHMITEFRNAELGEYQLSEKMYDDLFNKTIEEIFNDASHHHEGEDIYDDKSQELLIDKRAYHREIAPKFNGGMVNKNGLWVPR
jgi:hypothetical protein